MTPFSEITRRVTKLAIDNSPAIFTVIGVAGALTTAYLTGRASFKAAEILKAEYDERISSAGGVNEDWEPMVFREKVESTWKLYIPAAGSAIVTVAAIVCANRIGMGRLAALTAAYAIKERNINEYKDKIVEKLGPKKEEAARDEIAQQRINNNPVRPGQVIITGGGDVLCYDLYSDRYFQSSVEAIKRAVNDTNHQIMGQFSAALTDFYSRLEIPATRFSDDVGWNTVDLMDIHFSPGFSVDNRPCVTIEFKPEPKYKYGQVN